MRLFSDECLQQDGAGLRGDRCPAPFPAFGGMGSAQDQSLKHRTTGELMLSDVEAWARTMPKLGPGYLLRKFRDDRDGVCRVG